MKPEQYIKLGERVETVVDYRGLQAEYKAATRQWAFEYEQRTPKEREEFCKEARRKAEALAKALFELPEGTPGTGPVTEVDGESSLSNPDEGKTHEVRRFYTDYGSINIFKLANPNSTEFYAEYDTKEPGALVVQALNSDEGPIMAVTDEEELDAYISAQCVFPEVYTFNNKGSFIGMMDGLDNMEHIALSFGVEVVE